MKVDDLLKRLDEKKEIDEDERREVAEYIAQAFSDKRRRFVYHIMMKDKTIYDFDLYAKLVESNKVSPDDAYVFIEYSNFPEYYSANYFYPFLDHVLSLVDAYLSKLGFYSDMYHIISATGLKYFAMVNHFLDVDRTVVELVDIDTVVTNTNLPVLIRGVLGTKHIDDEVKEIVSQFASHKLFAGYDFMEAGEIIRKYYEHHGTSLAKDVAVINDAYNQIFQPYRTEYNRESKQIIASFQRKLFKD